MNESNKSNKLKPSHAQNMIHNAIGDKIDTTNQTLNTSNMSINTTNIIDTINQTNQLNQTKTSSKPTVIKKPKKPKPIGKITIISRDETNSLTILNHVFIKISCNKDISKISRYDRELLTYLLAYLNCEISAQTVVNYHSFPIKDYTITIPIYVNTDDEAKMKPATLISYRLQTIKNFMRNYQWEKERKTILWVVHALYRRNIDISKCLTIRVELPNNEILKRYNITKDFVSSFPTKPEHLQVSKFIIKSADIKRITLADGSMITQLINPYANDYGFFVNLSVPYDEMGMSYNALHLYEHLLCKPWKDLEQQDVKFINGSTGPAGISFVYNVHSSLESLQKYFNASLQWAFKSRNNRFWDNQQEDIKKETSRTISETRTERTLTSFGRSDYHAFNGGYDLSIFKYWSNKPFDFLIITPQEVQMNILSMNEMCKKYPINNVERPKNIILSNIPIEVMDMKNEIGKHSMKIETKDIIKAFLTGKFMERAYYGVDCAIVFEQYDKIDSNTFLYLLLYLNRYCKESELKEFIQSRILPRSANIYTTALLSSKEIEFDEEMYLDMMSIV